MSGAPVDRFTWERLFLKHSGLPSPSRLIGMVLLTKADPDLTIPARFSPSLSTLKELTGLGRGTVAVHLNHLEAAGWVRRIRPTTAASYGGNERTRYGLIVPAGVPVDEVQNTPSGSRTSPGAGRGVVREPDGGSPGAGHNPAPPNTSSSTSAADASGRGLRRDSSGAELEDVLDALRGDFPNMTTAEARTVSVMLSEGRPLPMVQNWLAKQRRAVLVAAAPAGDRGSSDPWALGSCPDSSNDPWALGGGA